MLQHDGTKAPTPASTVSRARALSDLELAPQHAPPLPPTDALDDAALSRSSAAELAAREVVEVERDANFGDDDTAAATIDSNADDGGHSEGPLPDVPPSADDSDQCADDDDEAAASVVASEATTVDEQSSGAPTVASTDRRRSLHRNPSAMALHETTLAEVTAHTADAPLGTRAQQRRASTAPRAQRACADDLYYTLLLMQADNLGKTAAAIQIDKDVLRSFPNLERDASFLTSLRRILLAYSVRNPVVGYCQSMNFLCGVLFIYLDEIEAFWMLTHVVEKLAPNYCALVN